MKKHSLRTTTLAGLLSAGLLAGVSAGAWADNLPVEKLTGGHSVTTPYQDRIYVMDAVFFHLVDSRVSMFDKNTGKFLGTVPSAFNGQAQLSKDGKKVYIATTYFERITRGARTDVIEVWDNDKLTFIREIVIPPKRAGSLNYDGVFRQTNDGRFVLVQNATPAQSITVVDMEKNTFTEEITASAGCWSIIPVPGTERSFSTICGDGTLLTLTLDANGKLETQSRSVNMFPVKDDPIFVTPGLLKDKMLFVSFYGNVYTASYGKDGMSFEPTWSLLDAEDRAKNWVPGGYNLMAVEPNSQRMYIFMHPDGEEGSHKNPAVEMWVYDLKSKKRIARVPGEDALSMSLIPGKKPQLVTIDVENVNIYDISGVEPKLINKIEGAAETSLQAFGFGG